MALEDYIIRSSSGSAEVVTLYHGSALVHANAIASSGIDFEQMKEASKGTCHSFCTSVLFEIAKGYALMNPLVRLAGVSPAILRFSVPFKIVQDYRTKGMVNWVYEDQALEWSPTTFAALNLTRTDVSIQTVTETTITFDE